MANNMAMKNRVYFKGWRPSEYIREILLKASLCVLPSRSESFGLSIAETLAQGVPLVTTLSGSIPEVVDYGRGAWLAKANDVYSLSNTMRVAIENYSESKKKAVFGKNFVRSNFSWAIAAKKYEDFYLKAIKNLE
jgi:glycosyltransferase involved in cell wall biosynthesis